METLGNLVGRRTVENFVLGFTPVHAVHDPNFEPKYEEFRSQTIWDLSNALTSAFKQLEPIPQFRATAKLGEFRKGCANCVRARHVSPSRATCHNDNHAGVLLDHLAGCCAGGDET